MKQDVKLLPFLPLMPAAVFLLAVYVAPTAYFIASSVLDGDGGLTLQHYSRLFQNETYVVIIQNTLKMAFLTTVFCVILGYPVAYCMATSRMGQNLILLILLPFWIAYLVRTFAWIVLLARNGVINSVLLSMGWIDRPLSLSYSLMAVIIGMVHAMLPLAILTMYATMKTIPTHYGRAAAVLGARGAQSFFRIYLPLSGPGVAASALMVFIICLGFFINPSLLGGRQETVITQVIIEQLSTTLDWGFAGAVAVLILAVTLVILFVYQKFFGLTSVTGMSQTHPDGRVSRTLKHAMKTLVGAMGTVCAWVSKTTEHLLRRVGVHSGARPRRCALTAFVAVIIFFLVAPVLFLIPVSFTKSSFMGWPPTLFSTQWYETYLMSPIWSSAITRSLIVGGLTALLATVVGTPAAFVLVRSQIKAKSTWMSFMIIPMILPHIILALALFSLYSNIGLVGSIAGLVLAHTVLAIPLVVITVASVLRNYDQRLDQAAYIMGARPAKTFFNITFPLVRTGFITAFLFAFITSFEELTVSLFVTGGLTSTLPKQMYEDAIHQVSPGLAALSTVILLVLTVVFLIAFLLRDKNATVELRG